MDVCKPEPYIGYPCPCPPCPWVLGGHVCDILFMGGHGCDIFGNTIGNVDFFEYMSAIWIAWVGMGGHMSCYGCGLGMGTNSKEMLGSNVNIRNLFIICHYSLFQPSLKGSFNPVEIGSDTSLPRQTWIVTRTSKIFFSYYQQCPDIDIYPIYINGFLYQQKKIAINQYSTEIILWYP